MFVTELDSFVKKFHQLWSDGHSAHLDLDTHAGRAWVGLRVQLGNAPPGHLFRPPHPQPPYRKPESPSRQRRRDRRAAAARKTEAEKASNFENAEEAGSNVIADEAVIEDNDVEKTGNKESANCDSTEQSDETLVGTAEEAIAKDMKVSDEVCPDEEYDLVEQVVVVPDHDNELEDNDVKEKTEEDLNSVGIKVIKIDTIDRYDDGKLSSCCAHIVPTAKIKIEEASFPLRVKGWALETS